MIAAIGRIISVRFPRICLSLLALAICSASCGGRDFRFAGRWVGYREHLKAEGVPPDLLNTMAKIDLTMEPGGRFEMLEAGIPKAGRFSVRDGKAYLKIETLFGKPIAEQGEGTQRQNLDIILEPDGEDAVRYTDPGAFDTEPVLLKRETKPR